MDVNFKFNEPGKPEPIYFEQIFGEKPGGGLLANPSYDVKPSTAIGIDTTDGKHKPIKCYKVVEAAADSATSIKIAKGSGIAVGDVIATGKKGVACTAVDTTTSEDYDVVTVTLGVALAKGAKLYQAAAASASAAVPKYTPKYVLGTKAKAGIGDQLVKLVNGANLRKETAEVADEIVALLKNIDLV